jgi:hypothetical protein
MMTAYLASLGFVVLAEMGDKTQLATVALAAKYESVIAIWLGTTSGMLVADGIGIIVGIVLGKRIPERFIKWFAAIIFIGFGVIGLCQTLPKYLLTLPTVAGFLGVVALLAFLVVRVSGGSKEMGNKENIELIP